MWHRSHLIQCRRQLYGMVCLLSLAGCAAVPAVDSPSRAELDRVMAPPSIVDPAALTAPGVDLLALTPAMKRLVADQIPMDAPDEERLSRLFELFKRHPDYFIAYDPNVTLTAAETFRQRRGNCLSFASMFIALAREAGLDARYQEVDTPATWDTMSLNVLVQYRHINVNVALPYDSPGVIDFRIDLYRSTYPQRTIADAEGLGHYYSNIGMGHLVDGNLAGAYVALHRALSAAPGKSFVWNNMGIIQRRLGNLAAAATSYRQALTLEPRDLSAITNLAGVYEEQGKPQLAAELRDYGYQIKLRDPYFRYALAQNAFQGGEYDEALRQLDVAVRRYKGDPRFYYLRGLSLWELGDSRAAITNLRRAIRVATEDDTADRYRQQLAEWKGNSG